MDKVKEIESEGKKPSWPQIVPILMCIVHTNNGFNEFTFAEELDAILYMNSVVLIK